MYKDERHGLQTEMRDNGSRLWCKLNFAGQSSQNSVDICYQMKVFLLRLSLYSCDLHIGLVIGKESASSLSRNVTLVPAIAVCWMQHTINLACLSQILWDWLNSFDFRQILTIEGKQKNRRQKKGTLTFDLGDYSSLTVGKVDFIKTDLCLWPSLWVVEPVETKPGAYQLCSV